jgi:hypothetical protein
MDRNRYVDLLRVLSIGGVVYGHWLLVSITYTGVGLGAPVGVRLAGRDAHPAAVAPVRDDD